MTNSTPMERSWVEINLAALQHNLDFLKSKMQAHQHFLMIVKADGYGHGAYEISRIALEAGAVYLGVANPEEGKLLRIQGCKAPILVLSPSLEQEIDTIIAYELCPTVSTLSFAKALNKAAQNQAIRQQIHLKVDTGMHRSGEAWSSFLKLYKAIAGLSQLHIEGIFSHFAAAENNREFSKLQEERFQALINSLDNKPKYYHISNSNAVVNGFGSTCNLVRLGILAYGIDTSGQDLPLKPVMTFKAILSQVKSIAKGESIGYNRSWIAETDTRYGILPIGYADGYDFLLGNNSQVALHRKLLAVLGRISMDMITIDLGNAPAAKVGDVLTLLGAGNEAIRAENIAARYDGSPYELLCQIGRRAKRYYYMGDKLLHSAPLSRRDFVPDDFSDSKLNQIIEAAIAQRLQSTEIGELIYREILRSFFYNKDKDIHYRHGFRHEITLAESLATGYYKATTTLSFEKILGNDYFIVACASSDEVLNRYFKRHDVEYRWLMDNAFELDPDSFSVSLVMVDELVLHTELKHINGCMEIKCTHPQLMERVGHKVKFTINTHTLYPNHSHQLSVFITELTQGVDIGFHYPDNLDKIECVPVFSGQEKYPVIEKSEGAIRVHTKPEQWVFPISGVVFSY